MGGSLVAPCCVTLTTLGMKSEEPLRTPARRRTAVGKLLSIHDPAPGRTAWSGLILPPHWWQQHHTLAAQDGVGWRPWDREEKPYSRNFHWEHSGMVGTGVPN